MGTTSPPLAAPKADRLATGAVGFGGQLFQSIARMAPAAGIVFTAPFMASQGGASLPLAFIMGTIAVMFVAFTLREVVRKVHSAGGYFVIHSVALGKTAGFTTSWLWLMFEAPITTSLQMFFGVYLSDFINQELGVDIPWWVLAIVMGVFLFFLSYLGVRLSTRLTILLCSIEVAILLILGIGLIAQAGSNQPLEAFTPNSSPNGLGGVFFGTVFALVALFGFESGIPLSEETDNPSRQLTRAILIATTTIGAFYIFMGYATVAGFGYTDPTTFAQGLSGASAPFLAFGTKVFGVIGPWIVIFALLNSVMSCSIGSQNSISRVFYSLGRAGLFPHVLAHVSRQYKTPDVAILFQVLLETSLALLLGFIFGPIPAYGLLGITFTVTILVVYAMTNLSTYRLYSGPFRAEFNVWKHLVIPLIGTLVLIPPLIATLAPQLIFGYSNTSPLDLGFPVVVVWFVIGMGYYLYLRSRRPDSLSLLENEMAYAQLVSDSESMVLKHPA